jgi:hypothetical protein
MFPKSYRFEIDKGIQAASATYRKAKQALEESLGIFLPNTRNPSEDFNETVDFITNITDKKVLDAYEKGLHRGLKQALMWLANGTLSVNNHEIIVNGTLKVRIKRRKSDNTYQILEYEFEPEDIGLNKVDQ